MKALLARQWNGSFSLLRYEPILAEVAGSGHADIYIHPGDPIGYRSMCADSVAALLGAGIPLTLKDVGATLEVEAFIVPRSGMTRELRELIQEAQILTGGSMAKTILVTALLIDEATGEVEDSNVTQVTGQTAAQVEAFVAAFEHFGADRTKEALSAGAKPEQIKQHRHQGKALGKGKP